MMRACISVAEPLLLPLFFVCVCAKNKQRKLIAAIFLTNSLLQHAQRNATILCREDSALIIIMR